MKRFLKTLVFFLVPIVLVTIVFEIHLRTKDTVYKQKLKGLQEGYNDIELLIFGNSHAYNDIDPRQFDVKSYNMAGSNQSIYFDKRITLKHLNKLTNLKYVLISFDYHSMYFSSQGIRDTWLYYDYDIKYKHKKELLSDISYFWFGYTPRITISMIKDDILSTIKNEQQTGDVIIKGWVPEFGQNESSFMESAIKSRANYFNGEIEKSTEYQEILDDLEDFIIRLRAKNIEPVFITAPMYQEIYKFLRPEYISENKKTLNYLKEKYNVPHWDFSKKIYDKSLYFNADHLNENGAKKFSKDLNEFLKKEFDF